MSPFASSILATLAVSLVAFVGIFFISVKRWSKKGDTRMVSFAAGVLLSAAFLELLPEATAEEESTNPLIAALVAMVAFFFLERFLHGFHVHEGSRATAPSYLILVGDGLHNLIDGVVIASAFIAGPELGVTATLAVVAHEIPQEIADYGILVRGGFSPKTALGLNFASGLTALLGAGATFALGNAVESHLAWFIAAAGGMFLYIAAADLLPEIQQEEAKGRTRYGLPFVVGLLVVGLLGTLIPE